MVSRFTKGVAMQQSRSIVDPISDHAAVPRRLRLLTVGAAALLVIACLNPASDENSPSFADLPAVPGDAPIQHSFLEVVLVRDAEHVAAGETARQQMLASTMLFQQQLGEHIDLYFDIREWGMGVDLNPKTVDSGETDRSDYLAKFTAWKENHLDQSARTYQPFGILFSDRAFQGTVGIGYLKQIGTAMSAAIVTHDIGTYGDLDGLRSAFLARYTGYVLGASTRSHSESGYILSITYEWPSPPTEYHPDSIDDMQAAIEAAVSDRGELPAVAAHPVGVSAASESVTLAWDFGDASSIFTVYRSDVPVPLSCLGCTSVSTGSQRYLVDTTVSSGATYHYRVVGRDPTGDLVAVSVDTVVAVP